MKKIVLTGGGTGGHIFPLLAVAEELQKNGGVELFYIDPNHPLNAEFEKEDIKILPIASSKLRRYFDWRNFTDVFKFLWSILQAIAHIFYLQPDLVFSKGGPGALPVILAAKCFFVPVVIHDSDAAPGLVSRLSAPFAEKIFLAFDAAAKYFPKNKTEVVGNPIRPELLKKTPNSQHPYILENIRMSVLVLGGSQGATRINSFVFTNLKDLLKFGSALHQVGERNLESTAPFNQKGYRAVAFLNAKELREALQGCDLVISRAGAAAIFEIAAFGKPSILIPLKESANDHQRKNAYEYAATGAAVVIEESNLNWPTMKTEIEKILRDKKHAKVMREAAKNFAKPDAASVIAEKLLKI